LLSSKLKGGNVKHILFQQFFYLCKKKKPNISSIFKNLPAQGTKNGPSFDIKPINFFGNGKHEWQYH